MSEIEVKWLIRAPRAWWPRWTGTVSYVVLAGDGVAYETLPLQLVTDTTQYPYGAWTRERLERKLARVEDRLRRENRGEFVETVNRETPSH